MNTDTFLLLMRGVSALSLLTFLGALAYFMQRELRAVEHLLMKEDVTRGELIITHPDGEIERVPLRPVLSIGRIPQNSIVLNNTYTSGQHALITFRENQWWVEDLGSRNGTLVNDVEIDEPLVISVGDEILIGDVALRLDGL